jgi:hypothetical protein
MIDDKNKRIAVAASVIMNADIPDSDGCPVCGYGAWGPEWTKVLTLAEKIVNEIDKVGYEYWRQESLVERNR